MRKGSLSEWRTWVDLVHEAHKRKAELDDRVSSGSVLTADEQRSYAAFAGIVERYYRDGRNKPRQTAQ
jgi:hypothetical protein